MKDNWNPSWLFVASPDYFYLDEVDRVIENRGKMDFLPYDYISEEINKKYLSILREFEPK